MLRLVILVAVWWIANAITSLASKTEMGGSKRSHFVEMRWLDLTAIQFLFGTLASCVWLKFVRRKTIRLETTTTTRNIVVILANLLGHLSVNVAYSFVSSSATQVIKSSEPMFMFALLTVFGFEEHKKQLNISVFLSLVLMVLGTCLFVMWDVTFNIWGVLAAVVSNIAFPLRNIALKKLDQTYNDPLEKYFTFSLYGSLILVPALCVKLAVFGYSILRMSKPGITSANFHCVYNIASIAVLREITPMNHAILNFAKRIFVIAANIKYFNTVLTWQMSIGLLIVGAGLVSYHFSQKNNETVSFKRPRLSRKACGSLCLGAGLLFYISTLVYHTEVLVVADAPVLMQERLERSTQPSTELTTAWVYQLAVPQPVVDNINLIQRQNPGTTVHVYCGSTQCAKAIENLNNPKVTATFVVIPSLLKGTPLEAWGMRHPLYKILTGLHFEDYLQEAVRLAHLWRYGGVFLEPNGDGVTENAEHAPEDGERGTSASSVLKVSRLTPRHRSVQVLVDKFLKKLQSWEDSETLPQMFHGNVWNAFTAYCPKKRRCELRNRLPLRTFAEQQGVTWRDGYHFGTISYDHNVGRNAAANIGDEVQSIPGLQFVPFVDFFLDREVQISPHTNGSHVVFFNAWWGRSTTRWPPAPNIDPIMVSVHIGKGFKNVVSKPATVDFLKRKAPIGCRDVATKRFLNGLGVDAFFSGCLTLFIKNPNAGKKRTDQIYIVDVNDPYFSLIPAEIRARAVRITHDGEYGRSDTLQTKRRYVHAYKLIDKYSRAKVVITQRIHSALPCVAMDTPVIFINGARMPGGGGDSKSSSDRVKGLIDVFHSLDMYKISLEETERWLKDFDWANPPKNPNLAMRMRMVTSAWNVIRKKRVAFDNARKFGLLPLTPRSVVGPHRTLFHLVFNELDEAPGAAAQLNWRDWRCIESILRHHPSSKLFLHGNSIRQTHFDVFTEVGYAVEVKRYNIKKLALDTPIEMHLKTNDAGVAKRFLKHGILKLLLLYKYGGVYLDTDAIVVRPMNDLTPNAIGLDSEMNVNGGVMRFEVRHPFIEATLERFATFYSEKVEADHGTLLLTKVWESWLSEAQGKRIVQKVDANSFYMFPDKHIQKECLTDTTGPTFEEHMARIQNDSYVVRLHSKINLHSELQPERSKLKEGTVCEHLFNAHCILCNNIY